MDKIVTSNKINYTIYTHHKNQGNNNIRGTQMGFIHNTNKPSLTNLQRSKLYSSRKKKDKNFEHQLIQHMKASKTQGQKAICR